MPRQPALSIGVPGRRDESARALKEEPIKEVAQKLGTCRSLSWAIRTTTPASNKWTLERNGLAATWVPALESLINAAFLACIFQRTFGTVHVGTGERPLGLEA